MKKRGFTLIELLVVIAIITILAGMVVGGAQQARKRGAITKARSQIATLETAISMYETDIGIYPESGNKNLTSALIEDPDDLDWSGPYMKIRNQLFVYNKAIRLVLLDGICSVYMLQIFRWVFFCISIIKKILNKEKRENFE